MYEARFYNTETNSLLLRLSKKRVLNKYFWEKEKAEAVEKLAKQREIPKQNILVEDLSTEQFYA